VHDAVPIDLRTRVWFNPEINSRHFLVPGLIAIIMTLIGALLTALVVAREWERGTMEALLTTRLTRGEFLLGKIAPYFLLGMGGMAAAVTLSVTLFGLPFRGSVWLLVVCSAVFMLAMLGIGLLISTLTRNQFVASIAALLSTMLPAVMLSGFLFDIAWRYAQWRRCSSG
jgi:ABC-2 type transport system permease protein